QRPDGGVSPSPPPKPVPGLGFRGRPGDLQKRHRGPAPARRPTSLAGRRRRNHPLPHGRPSILSPPGGLDSRRLTGLFVEVGRPWCVGQPGGLIAGSKLEERLDRTGDIVDLRPRVAGLGEPLGDGVDRELIRLAPRHLFPTKPGRYAGVGRGTGRVRRRDRSVLGVLVVVEEDPVALLLPPLAGGHVGGLPLDLTRQRDSRATDLHERPARFYPAVDVEAAGAGRLRPPDETE